MRIEGESIVDLKMLIMQKDENNNGFSTISRVGGSHGSKKQLSNNDKKARSNTDLQVRWIFDRFLVDFGTFV